MSIDGQKRYGRAILFLPGESSLPNRVLGHYIQHEETVEADLKGTIIDIETVGDFRAAPFCQDTEDYLSRYRDMRVTTVGILAAGQLMVFAAKGVDHLTAFQKSAIKFMSKATGPLHAFNKAFKEGCYYWNSGREILDIDREIQMTKGEKKEVVVRGLGLSGYDDPFNGEGRLCVRAFQSGKVEDIIKHNRACLLKEYGILNKRGAREFRTKWLDLNI